MARRVPFPWETDREVERVELTDRSADASTDGPCGVPGAEEAAARVAGDVDPDRARRGASGAADAMFKESQARGWGLTREACRDRVNLARARSAAKRRT